MWRERGVRPSSTWSEEIRRYEAWREEVETEKEDEGKKEEERREGEEPMGGEEDRKEEREKDGEDPLVPTLPD